MTATVELCRTLYALIKFPNAHTSNFVTLQALVYHLIATVNTKMISIILIKVSGVTVGNILIWCIIVLVRPNSKIP